MLVDKAVVTGLENDKIYSIEVNLSELPEYLNEVVTVADLAKSIQKQLAGDGPSGTSSTWDYHVQAVMGDVVGDDDKVDFQDSYEIMAYLQAVEQLVIQTELLKQVQHSIRVVLKELMVITQKVQCS